MSLSQIKILMDAKNLDAVILTSRNRYYIYDTKSTLLGKITNFSGTNAICIISNNKYAFFTDGRYITQAQNEINKNFEIFDIARKSITTWCNENNISSIGFDPFSVNPEGYKPLNMVPLTDFFQHQTSSSNHVSSIFNYDIKFSGKSTKEKFKDLSFNTDYLLITSPESVCWLLNIRGNDLVDSPIILSYAFISKEGNIDVFTEYDISIPELEVGMNINWHKIESIEKFIKNIRECSIQLSPNAPYYFFMNFQNITIKDDPCLILRARKNSTEIEGAINAHIEDGLALLRSIIWMKHTNEIISELSISQKLLEFRKKSNKFIQQSFETIAGFSDNSAIIHYHPSINSNKVIDKNNILLIDSGGHYLGGTTDVTRTFHLGSPTNHHKKIYTLVLKGHIALASTIFPKNTKGAQLDAIARQFLWKEGLDFSHGTGHGVGNCLSVHEGPISISPMSFSDNFLEENMITSIEPGYYRAKEFGVRIENLYVIKKHSDSFLCFSYLTMVPFECDLMERSLLTKDEICWIQDYHKKILTTLEDFLDKDEIKWYKKNYIDHKIFYLG